MDGFRKGRVVLRRCGEIIFGMLGCRAEKEGVYGYMESWKACAVLGRCAVGWSVEIFFDRTEQGN